jgi:hypothetical protein
MMASTCKQLQTCIKPPPNGASVTGPLTAVGAHCCGVQNCGGLRTVPPPLSRLPQVTPGFLDEYCCSALLTVVIMAASTSMPQTSKVREGRQRMVVICCLQHSTHGARQLTCCSRLVLWQTPVSQAPCWPTGLFCTTAASTQDHCTCSSTASMLHDVTWSCMVHRVCLGTWEWSNAHAPHSPCGPTPGLHLSCSTGCA